MSADIFAIVLSVRNDQGLGQKVEELSGAVDAISPMVYPSHYSPGWLGLDNPNNYPSEVVEEALGCFWADPVGEESGPRDARGVRSDGDRDRRGDQ